MKDLTLIAINAKYPHTNLAVRCLREAVMGFQIETMEVSINDSLHGIIERLLQIDTYIYGFSCYIWNIEIVYKVAEVLKKAKPDAIILLGGPEVSFDSAKLLDTYGYLDIIIAGEAEAALRNLLVSLRSGTKIISDRIFYQKSFCFSKSNQKHCENDCEKQNFEEIIFPYTSNELESLKNRIIYYETMRGCPYNCSYCLSSADKKLRIKNLAFVFKEIDLFFAAEVKQVKLVDRTFNCQPERSIEIFRYIIERAYELQNEKKLFPNFHFEVTGNLITFEMIEILKKAPPGLIQFEIGVQSTNEKTLDAIGRPIKLEQIKDQVTALLNSSNIHIHLDLIAGLPHESFVQFRQSFNDVFELEPDMLQLGFLKGLKGTNIRQSAAKHGYIFSDFPPYEIIKNDYIEAEELYLLRNMESLLDRYYNSGNFETTFKIILSNFKRFDPFIFFYDFSKWWKVNGFFEIGVSKEKLYGLIYEFIREQEFEDFLIFENALIFDFVRNNQMKCPDFLEVKQLEKQKVFDFIRAEENQNYLKSFLGLATKKIFNQIKILEFEPLFCAQLFKDKSLYDVSAEQSVMILFTPDNFHCIK
ncbi:DUF4080 domain-containing protein [Eubacteriaceae bacterium ES3]|nr:DUF4080 domain-containing protein [Eubacteriaceae bacterium ES3]